jgi:hypothetical protein
MKIRCPCKDCIIIPICRSKYVTKEIKCGDILFLNIFLLKNKCKLLHDFIYDRGENYIIHSNCSIVAKIFNVVYCKI